MRGTICFVSDFGLEDTWVGVCHAVIYELCPEAHVVDLAHQIPPFDVRRGAAIAASGVYQLPEAIHLVVVDPGVGGSRRDVCVVTGNGCVLLGPDNGVLLPAATRAGGIVTAVMLEPGLRDGDSRPLPTFHARDVLAPAAARIACGEDPAKLGQFVDPSSLVSGPFGICSREGDHVVSEVVDVDRFGSVRLNVPEEDLESLGLSAAFLKVSFGHTSLEVPLLLTFSDVEVGEPAMLVDSSGWLTLAIRQGSAAERYGIEPGVSARVSQLTGT